MTPFSLVTGVSSTSSSLSQHIDRISRGGGDGGSLTTAFASTVSAFVSNPTFDDDDFINECMTNQVYDSSLSTRGGGGDDGRLSIFGRSCDLSPQGCAVVNMAIAMSLHYLAYNLARPTTLALFTSSKMGFKGSSAAYALAMAFISPTSLFLLVVYGRILRNGGPRATLRRTTYLCSSVLSLSAGAVHYLSQRSTVNPIVISLMGMRIPLLQTLVGALFVFRESYVQLISSQYWSFMSSVLTPEQSAKWFAPVTGLTSVMSAVAGMGVSSLVERVTLPGALGVASLVLFCSLIFTEKAYAIADAHGFNPGDETKKSKNSKKKQNNDCHEDEDGLVKKAFVLFSRVKVLKALFFEVLAGQSLATLLNVCFVSKLSQAIPEDSVRAGWMGKFYGITNVISSFLQFAVLPQIMPFIEPALLWRLMPTVMVTISTCLSLNKDISLYLISGTFMLWKVMEFSIRRPLDEMVYVPLDYESRYVGKEIIGVLGYRFGKSGVSLALTMLTGIFGTFGIHQLSFFTTGAAALWFITAWNVSNLVPKMECYSRGKG